MPKVCFVQIVFQSDYVLEPCLQSILPYGPVVVCEGPVEFYWRRGWMTSTDRTNDVLRHYIAPGQQVHGRWKEKDEMMQAIEGLIPPDTEFVWMVDSDEIYAPETIERMLALLDTGEWDSVEFRPYSFYGGFERFMVGFEENPPCGWHRIQRWQPTCHWQTHRPPTVLAQDGRPWREHRHMNANQSETNAGRFFHYSYVFPSQIKAKTEYYRYRNPRGTIPDYFKRVYLPWVLGDNDRKAKIERLYNGVHDNTPDSRAACPTRLFVGIHPPTIMSVLPKLKARFDKELGGYVR